MAEINNSTTDSTDSGICPSINSGSWTPPQTYYRFWEDRNNWDHYRIGWSVSFVFALITCLISLTTILCHAFHYEKPKAQRQTMRIMLLPPTYAIVSFLSYQWFQKYTLYEVGVAAYEGVVLGAFIILLMEIARLERWNEKYNEAPKKSERETFLWCLPKPKKFLWIFDRKEPVDYGDQKVLWILPKRPEYISGSVWLPFPMMWSQVQPDHERFPKFRKKIQAEVMQYVVVSIICALLGTYFEAQNEYCDQSMSPHFAHFYIAIAKFFSVSLALWALVAYEIVDSSRLHYQQPVAKFWAVKGIVAVVFYQSFVLDQMTSHDMIKGYENYTADNVANAYSAVLTAGEMILFALYMAFAFTHKEYLIEANFRVKHPEILIREDDLLEEDVRTGPESVLLRPLWALWQTFFLWDLVVAIFGSGGWLWKQAPKTARKVYQPRRTGKVEPV